jgi:hypothetical protein
MKDIAEYTYVTVRAVETRKAGYVKSIIFLPVQIFITG